MSGFYPAGDPPMLGDFPEMMDLYLCAVVEKRVCKYVSLADTLDGANSWKKSYEASVPRSTECLVYKIIAQEI